MEGEVAIALTFKPKDKFYGMVTRMDRTFYLLPE